MRVKTGDGAVDFEKMCGPMSLSKKKIMPEDLSFALMSDMGGEQMDKVIGQDDMIAAKLYKSRTARKFNPCRDSIVAFFGGRALAIQSFETDESSDTARDMGIDTNEEFQNMGVGKRLRHAACLHLMGLGVKKLSIRVEKNESAQRLAGSDLRQGIHDEASKVMKGELVLEYDIDIEKACKTVDRSKIRWVNKRHA